MKKIELSLDGWELKKLDLLDKSIVPSDLQEDMFQIEQGKYLVDSGWYEAIDAFITYLITNFNWDEPLVKIVSKNHYHCIDAISFCVGYTEKLISDTQPDIGSRSIDVE